MITISFGWAIILLIGFMLMIIGVGAVVWGNIVAVREKFSSLSWMLVGLFFATPGAGLLYWSIQHIKLTQ